MNENKSKREREREIEIKKQMGRKKGEGDELIAVYKNNDAALKILCRGGIMLEVLD